MASWVWGCAPLVADVPGAGVGPEPDLAAAETPGVPAPPATLSLPASAPADWLSKGAEAPDSLFEGKRVVFVGHHTAVAFSGPDDSNTRFAWSIDTTTERVQRIGPPAGTVHLLVTGPNDAIVAATAAGDLFRADDPVRARDAAGFVRFGAVPGAVAWDVAGQWWVAASGSDVWVSSNGGKSFRRHHVTAASVVAVAVREDGLVLAGVDEEPLGGLYLSRGGYGWHRSPTTVAGVHRAGRWIVGEASSCSDTLAVLAAGTTTWMRDDDPARVLPDPTRVLEAWPSARGWMKARYFTFDDPPVPRLDPRRALPPDPAVTQAFGCAKGRPPPRRHAKPKWRVTLGPETAQFFLLRDFVAPSSRKLALLANARCDARDAWVDGRCEVGRGLTAFPQAVRYDAARADVLDLPEGCREPRTDNYGGLGMLSCGGEADAPRYYFDGVRPELVAEHVPYPIEPYGTQGPDGSLLFRARCADPKVGECPFVVRRATAPGASDAWWSFRADHAVALRLLEGGWVLAVRRLGVREPDVRGPLQTVVRVGLVAPDEPERTIATEVTLREPTHEVDVENGHVVLTGEGRRWALLEDGALMEL